MPSASDIHRALRGAIPPVTSRGADVHYDIIEDYHSGSFISIKMRKGNQRWENRIDMHEIHRSHSPEGLVGKIRHMIEIGDREIDMALVRERGMAAPPPNFMGIDFAREYRDEITNMMMVKPAMLRGEQVQLHTPEEKSIMRHEYGKDVDFLKEITAELKQWAS